MLKILWQGTPDQPTEQLFCKTFNEPVRIDVNRFRKPKDTGYDDYYFWFHISNSYEMCIELIRFMTDLQAVESFLYEIDYWLGDADVKDYIWYQDRKAIEARFGSRDIQSLIYSYVNYDLIYQRNVGGDLFAGSLHLE